jgi:aminoglycoside phosphotransferase (APT) family kinase protein
MSNLLDHQLLKYITSRHPGVEILEFKFLARGFESEIYTFCLQFPDMSQKYFVLRMFPGDGAAEKLNREANALCLLQKAGYPVPGLLLQETDPQILGMPFEIIEKLEGQALWPALAMAEADQADQLLKRFGQLLAQLHNLDLQLFVDQLDIAKKESTNLLDKILSEYRTLYTKYDLKGFIEVLKWLDAHKNEISMRPAIVHQDFHANNVFLCTNDQLSVIDWTQFAVSDHRIDLCWTLLIMGDLGNPDWKSKILNAYTTEFKGPVENLDYFNVIVYMKLLASAVISVSFNPEEIGLQSGSVDAVKAQLPIYRQLAQRIQNITGMAVPELDKTLNEM